MPIISSIINWVNTKRLHQIDLFRKYPIDVQRETFFKLLDEAKDTWIGKEYGFSEIQSFSEFQEKVPVRNYEAYKPLISRVMEGEQNLFWPSEIKWFAKSSESGKKNHRSEPNSRNAVGGNHEKEHARDNRGCTGAVRAGL